MKIAISPTFYDQISYVVEPGREGKFTLELVGPKGEIIYSLIFESKGAKRSAVSTGIKPQNKGKHKFLIRDEDGKILQSVETVYTGEKPKLSNGWR